MGVSNKNAQDNIQPKGNKKPLQVLHINKKDTQKIENEQTNSQEDTTKENIAIKPQITKDESVKEIATQAMSKKTGARGLSSILESLLYYSANYKKDLKPKEELPPGFNTSTGFTGSPTVF